MKKITCMLMIVLSMLAFACSRKAEDAEADAKAAAEQAKQAEAKGDTQAAADWRALEARYNKESKELRDQVAKHGERLDKLEKDVAGLAGRPQSSPTKRPTPKLESATPRISFEPGLYETRTVFDDNHNAHVLSLQTLRQCKAKQFQGKAGDYDCEWVGYLQWETPNGPKFVRHVSGAGW